MKGFNGDIYLFEKVQELIKSYKVNRIIETGTHEANTTLVLATLGIKVDTIEINENYFNASYKHLKDLENVAIYKGSSPNILRKILPYKLVDKILFYLDAHWYDYNPLIDELKIISAYGLNNCVIVIHDFKNPNHPEFGFDKFPNGDEYTLDKIEKYLKDIYGENKYNVEYNEKATGAMRGVIFISPKVVNEEA